MLNSRLNNLPLLKIIIITFLTFIFFLKGVIFLDPDFGWHIRYGQIILNSGFPSSDPFSYTMSSYNYANHEWLLDVIFALLYPFTGLEGLSLIFALVTILTIFLLIPKSTKLWQYSVVFLTSAIFLSFTGIRPQIISWFLFVVVLKIILSRRYFFLLPFIFLLWANLHAGFIMGLAVLLIYTVCQFLSKRKLLFSKIFIVVSSILVTLMNPYYFRLWQEVWATIPDPLIRRDVEEWFPLVFAPHPLIIIWLLLSAILFIKYRLLISLFEKIFYLTFFLITISSVRHTPFFILASLPKVYIYSEQYIKELKKIPIILYEKLHISIFLLFLTVFLLVISHTFNQSYIEAKEYPSDAVSFLKKHDFEGELFAPYNWGGYLIWQYPQKKVFIDGRMPSWRQTEKVGESAYALDEYFKVFSSKSESEKIFNKYHINIVLWSNPSKKTSLDFIKILQDLGWQKIYSDSVSVVYMK